MPAAGKRAHELIVRALAGLHALPLAVELVRGGPQVTRTHAEPRMLLPQVQTVTDAGDPALVGVFQVILFGITLQQFVPHVIQLGPEGWHCLIGRGG